MTTPQRYRFLPEPRGQWTVETDLRGHDLCVEPLLNRGSAFTAQQRREFGLEGLLPGGESTIDRQAARVHEQIVSKGSPFEQYLELAALQDRNEVLFFRVMAEHLEQFLPIIYTPTVAEATRRFSENFRRGRGLYLNPDLKGRFSEAMRAVVGGRDIRMIVATDNEAILGIGDQGVGGMAIPVGKLAIYTLAAGIHPSQVLPVCLDVGTDNHKLRADSRYLGANIPRLRGAAYREFIEEFVGAVRAHCPNAILQWEDFRKDLALEVLERYREVLPSFNDDIQGTGAIALAGMMSATRVLDQPLSSHRIVVYGAGAAGTGITRQLRSALQSAGLDAQRAHHAVAVLDSRGLLVKGGGGDPYKESLGWDRAEAGRVGLASEHPVQLLQLVERWKPTALIGTSGVFGSFDENIVRAMLRGGAQRPIIFALSNPDTNSEATPAELLAWTQGRGLIATGSPFPPTTVNGAVHHTAQGNNALVFPGIGLGALVSRARRVSVGMITAAANALAAQVTPAELAEGQLLPGITRLPEVSVAVAAAVARTAIEEGLAAEGFSIAAIGAAIDRQRWTPQYPLIVPLRTR